jgi:hypothetical protein
MGFKISAATVITVLLFHFVSAQNVADTKLDNKQSLLNGRAYLNFPNGAANVERPVDIMSAGHNPNEETRIIYNNGKIRLVFFARELYLASDKNLFEELSKDSAYKLNFASKVFLNKDSIFAILSTPIHYDSSQGGIMVESLLVQTPDGCLFRVDAYINAIAFEVKEQYQSLSVNIFQTLVAGERRLKRNERDEKYFLLDSSQAFYFHLPTDYCRSIDQKYDFKVFKFHKIRDFTDDTWGDMLIYVGDHPSYVYMDYGLDPSTAKKDSGMFAGKQVKWMFFTDQMQGVYIKEEVIANDTIGVGVQMHIAMVANSLEPFAELTKIVEDVKLQRK